MESVSKPVPTVDDRRVPWPNGIRIAVMLSFDFDAETLFVAVDPDNAKRPVTLSQGRYGAIVGIPRILKLLDKYGIKATFFVIGQNVERYPEAIKEIDACGHEIGTHMYTHAKPDTLPPDVEEEHLKKSIDVIENLIGKKVRGYRSPGSEYSAVTLELLEKCGMEYDATDGQDDIPYYIEIDGRVTDMVELPFQWVLDDAPLFWFCLMPPINYGAPYSQPSKAYELWTTEFDAMYEEGGLFDLCMHPFVTGRPNRTKLLERTIQHIQKHPHVWFATASEIVAAYKQVVPKSSGKPGVWFQGRDA